jgi:magnesium transporter
MKALVLEGDGTRLVEGEGAADAIAQAHRDGRRLWVDLGDRTEAAEHLLEHVFALHPLVIEDVWGDRALPKIDRYDDYLFVLVHGVRAGSSATDLDLLEVDVVIGESFVLTHHVASRAVTALWDEAVHSPRVLEKGPARVLHGVLDEIVDDYFPVLGELDGAIDDLEERVLTEAGLKAGNALMTRILDFKRTVQVLRRNGLHQREIFLRLGRDEFAQIPPDAVPFFRDVYDHFARAVDLTDDYRELLGSALEAFFSMQSNRMNEIVKTLTLISTVMLPLSFLAGVYGMNFRHMPELEWRLGYPYALALMGAVAAAILVWFKRRGWL